MLSLLAPKCDKQLWLLCKTRHKEIQQTKHNKTETKLVEQDITCQQSFPEAYAFP